jgi:hypothetical protein
VMSWNFPLCRVRSHSFPVSKFVHVRQRLDLAKREIADLLKRQTLANPDGCFGPRGARGSHLLAKSIGIHDFDIRRRLASPVQAAISILNGSSRRGIS